MPSTPLHLKLNFRQFVWHDQPYISPQTKQTIERDFFDHVEAIHQALSILQEPSVRTPVIIIGERRAGKTSLLKLLLYKLTESEDQHFIGIDIPVLGIDSALRLMEEFLDSLFLAVDPEDPELQKEVRQVSDQRDFEATMKKILNYKPESVVVFGIDEIDSILQDQVTDQVAQKEILRLINFLSESTTLPIKLILTTTREPEKFGAGYQLTANAKRIRLSPFSVTDYNEMTSNIFGKDLEFSEQERDAVYALSGGWPYWAKALLYPLVQLPQGDQRMQQAKIEAIQSTSFIWKHIYEKHWDEQQRALILFIAQNGGQINTDKIRIHSNFTIAMHELIERGYILHNPDGYRFQIQLLQDWLSQWVEFKDQVHKHHGFLSRLTPELDPWADGDNDVVEISKEDLRQRGL
jgi:hypothetical protein